MSTQGDKFKEIADAIREKDETTEPIVANDFAERIKAIPTGIDTSDADATSSDIVSPKTAYVKGEKVTGTIVKKDSTALTASGATVTVPAGYYPTSVSKSVTTVTHPNPTQTLDTSSSTSYAYVKASHTQDSGYVTGGTTTSNYSITKRSGGTYKSGYNSSSSSTTILSSGLHYLTSPIYMQNTSTLVASNIRSGVNILGITGSYTASLGFVTVTVYKNNAQYNATIYGITQSGSSISYTISQTGASSYSFAPNSLIVTAFSWGSPPNISGSISEYATIQQSGGMISYISIFRLTGGNATITLF